MSRTYQEDNKLMDLLKVTEISRIICDTNMGTLKLRLKKGETSYQFLLDAVELPKELNKEVMELLFPKPIPQPKTDIAFSGIDQLPTNTLPPKPKGRPKGSKNKSINGKQDNQKTKGLRG